MSRKEKLSLEELVFVEDKVVLAWFGDCTAQVWMHEHYPKITGFLHERLAFLMRNGPMGLAASSHFQMLVRGFMGQAECRIGRDYSSERSVQEWIALERFVAFSARRREDAVFYESGRSRSAQCAAKILKMVQGLDRAEPLRYEAIIEKLSDWRDEPTSFTRKEIARAILHLAYHREVGMQLLIYGPALFRVVDSSD
jgi:hypothetical protein